MYCTVATGLADRSTVLCAVRTERNADSPFFDRQTSRVTSFILLIPGYQTGLNNDKPALLAVSTN